MLRIVLVMAATAWCGPGIILSNRRQEMLKAADDLGNSIVEMRREKEDNRRAEVQERRQASLDSMARINDSLAAEIKRIELRRKQQELDRAYWEFVRDSVKAARAEAKRKQEPATE